MHHEAMNTFSYSNRLNNETEGLVERGEQKLNAKSVSKGKQKKSD